MPMIATKPDGAEVAFFLPEDWYERRGDVCVYATFGELCYVRRGEAGYTPIPVYECPGRGRGPQRAQLSPDDATAIACQINARCLGVMPLEARRIVSSSMLAQNRPKRRAASC